MTIHRLRDRGRLRSLFLALGGGGSGNLISEAAFGSEPSSPAEGDVVLYNNAPLLARWNGTIWEPWGPLFNLNPPVPGDFSWVNQGTASLNTSQGGIQIIGPSVGGDNIRAQVRTAPATPYTITALLCMNFGNAFPTTGGLCFRQTSNGRMVVFGGFWTNLIGSQKFTSATSFNSDYSTGYSFVRAPFIWLRLADNGTNRIMSASYDGINFITLHSITRTDWLTADQVGFYVHPTGTAANITCLSWTQA